MHQQLVLFIWIETPVGGAYRSQDSQVISAETECSILMRLRASEQGVT
jgi:hypothetical protein